MLLPGCALSPLLGSTRGSPPPSPTLLSGVTIQEGLPLPLVHPVLVLLAQGAASWEQHQTRDEEAETEFWKREVVSA